MTRAQRWGTNRVGVQVDQGDPCSSPLWRRVRASDPPLAPSYRALPCAYIFAEPHGAALAEERNLSRPASLTRQPLINLLGQGRSLFWAVQR